MKLIKIILTVLLTSGALIAQNAPADEQSKSILIKNVTINDGNGNIISDGAVGLKEGKFDFVGKGSEANESSYEEVMDGANNNLYPGFISMNIILGLTEVNAVRATRDFNEVGDFNPHVRSIIAYNAESKLISVSRQNGILMAQVTPRGNRIAGSSSVVQLDAWNWEDATINTDEGIHLYWPNSISRKRSNGKIIREPNNKYKSEIEKLESFFSEASAQVKGNKLASNLKFKAMSGLFNGSKTLYVHADRETEILDAISFKKEFSLNKLVIVGGYDSYKITDSLKKNNIAVVLGEVHSLPSLPEHDIHLPFKLPKLLMDAGVLVAISNSNPMQTRNLPFYAGTVVGQGLSKENALKLLTSNPAKIMGMDSTIGSIGVGKDATFFLSAGDALDMRGNKIGLSFIQGREINLDNHQRELYRRYMKKYNPQFKEN